MVVALRRQLCPEEGVVLVPEQQEPLVEAGRDLEEAGDWPAEVDFFVERCQAKMEPHLPMTWQFRITCRYETNGNQQTMVRNGNCNSHSGINSTIPGMVIPGMTAFLKTGMGIGINSKFSRRNWNWNWNISIPPNYLELRACALEFSKKYNWFYETSK